MVIFFDVLFGICVVATLWFAYYVIRRLITEETDSR